MGNRQSETRTKAGVSVTTTYAYDANDRLQGEAASDGSTTTYAYDANGSLTGKGTSVYSYDGDRRLVDAITPNAGMSYRYDANGIRQSQTVNGVTTRFVVDPTAQYAQVLEERSSTGNVLYLLGDDRIARTQGGTTHYHADGLGSTRLLTTSTGQGADRWWYEAFGEVETSTGSSGNTFLFAGEQLDPNLGHYYLRARYMDPANGRFTQMDLFSGYDSDPVSLHKYLYANGSPVDYSDPSGYYSISELSTVSGVQKALSAIAVNTTINVAQEIVVQYLVLGDVTISHLRQAVFDAENLLPPGAKKTARMAGAVGSFVKHFRAFVRSPQTRKAWGRGNNYVEIDGPSTPRFKTNRLKIGAFKIKNFHVSFHVGGKPGRVFQVMYKMGRNAVPGQGFFEFRFDYMDFQSAPPKFDPHIHVRYNDVKINHGKP